MLKFLAKLPLIGAIGTAVTIILTDPRNADNYGIAAGIVLAALSGGGAKK